MELQPQWLVLKFMSALSSINRQSSVPTNGLTWIEQLHNYICSVFIKFSSIHVTMVLL